MKILFCIALLLLSACNSNKKSDTPSDKEIESNKNLYFLVENRNIEEIKKYIDSGKSINLTDKYDGSPLNVATEYGYFDVVQLLVEAGADIYTSPFPLTSAVVYNNTNIFDYLIEKGVDVNFSKDGDTALHTALLRDYKYYAYILLEKGGDVNITNKLGKTALHIAAEKGYTDIVQLLLDQGITNINSSDTIALLEQGSADFPNRSKYRGNTPIEYAAKNNHTDTVRLLVEYGAELEDDTNTSALVYSAMNGNTPLVSYLIEKGASTDTYNQALLIAVQSNHIETAKFLIKSGANVNTTDQDLNTPLIEAARQKNLDMIKFLLDSGADINAKNDRYYTALYISGREYFGTNNTAIISYLTEQGATNVSRESYEKSQDSMLNRPYYDNINSLVILLTNADVPINFEEVQKITDRKSMENYLFSISKNISFSSETASQILEKSILCKMDNLAKLMIKKGADVNATNEEGKYMLELAAKHGFQEEEPMVSLLIDNKVDISLVPDSTVENILELSFIIGDQKLREFIINQIGFKNKNIYSNLLNILVEKNELEFIKQAIENGANPNGGPNTYTSPLYEAVSQENEDIVEYLISQGADVNISIPHIGYIMYEAIRKNNYNIVKLLIDGGNDLGNTNYNPLSYAFNCGASDQIVNLLIEEYIKRGLLVDNSILLNVVGEQRSVLAQYLIDSGADVNMQGQTGYTPLMLAVSNNDMTTVDLLLKSNVDLEKKEKIEEYTALHIASKLNHLDIIQNLLNTGADINATGRYGFTPLVIAIDFNNTEGVQLLLKNNVNVNKSIDFGSTPLMRAAKQGNIEIVKLLLDAGADINIKDDDDDTAIDWALYYNQYDIANYLKSIRR